MMMTHQEEEAEAIRLGPIIGRILADQAIKLAMKHQSCFKVLLPLAITEAAGRVLAEMIISEMTEAHNADELLETACDLVKLVFDDRVAGAEAPNVVENLNEKCNL